MRVELELRNLPRFRVIEYLVAAGGAVQNAYRVVGDGWTAELHPMPPAEIGVMRIPRDLLVIQGDAAQVEPVHDFMRQKTMRGGG